MAVEPTTSYQDINEDVVHAYNADLKQFADHATVFTALEGMVTPGHITQVPGAAIFKYQLKDMQVDITTRMAMPLKLAASYGDNQVRETQGEESRYKVRRAFANSYFKVMDQKDNKRTFGGHAKGKALFDLASKLLKDHSAWTRDDFFHQAVLDGVSANLTSAASGGPALTPSVAKNIYIHGADNLAHTLPAYSNNPTTHLATLMTALNTVTGDASAVPIVDLFSRLQTIIFNNWRIRSIGGIYSGSVVVLLHPGTALQLRLLQSAGSLKALQRTTFNDKIASEGWTMDLGMLGRLELIEDPRCPIGVLDNINTAATFSHVYRGVGENDPRLSYDNSNTAVRKVFHANIILGAGGIDHASAVDLMYDDQIRDMSTLVQLGYSAIEGMKRGHWDETPSANQDTTTAVEDAAGVLYTWAF